MPLPVAVAVVLLRLLSHNNERHFKGVEQNLVHSAMQEPKMEGSSFYYHFRQNCIMFFGGVRNNPRPLICMQRETKRKETRVSLSKK